MHRIFSIPEIFDLILRSLYEAQCREPAIISTLFALSLTCSTFKDPSLDLLWRDLTSLKPLLLLLPRDALKHENWTGWILHRPLTRGHWFRFNVHAHRVRSLSLSCTNHFQSDDLEGRSLTHSHFSRSFFRSLQQAYCSSNVGAMLPRLKSFTLDPYELSDFDCCPIFMASNLETLTLVGWRYGRDSSSESRDSFCLAVTHSPAKDTIRNLSIPTYQTYSGRIRSRDFLPLVHVLEFLPSLKRMDLGRKMHDHPGILECLVESMRLEELVATGGCLISESPPTGKLKNLCSLNMNMYDIRAVAHLLPNDTIKTMRASSVETVGKDLALLSSKCAGSKTLDLTFSGEGLGTIAEILSPLLSACKGLVDVKLNFRSCVDLLDPSNDDFLAIAQAWPHLQTFTILTRRAIPDSDNNVPCPIATIQGTLEAFATHCRDLRSLTLELMFAWDEEEAVPRQLFASLEALELGGIVGIVSSLISAEDRVGPTYAEIWNYIYEVSDRSRGRISASFTWREEAWSYSPLGDLEADRDLDWQI